MLFRSGGFFPVSYAAVAAGYGAKTYTVHTPEELKAAMKESKKQRVSTLIDLKVLPKTMTHDYGSWWHVGIAGVPGSQSQKKAYEQKEQHRKAARKY